MQSGTASNAYSMTRPAIGVQMQLTPVRLHLGEPWNDPKILPDGTGFFNGDELVGFEHAVKTAYYWPVDDLSDRLQHASRRSNASYGQLSTNPAVGPKQPS